MLGHEGEECEVLTLTGPLNKIEASVIQLESLSFALNSVRYVRDPNQKTFGFFLGAFAKTWEFTED